MLVQSGTEISGRIKTLAQEAVLWRRDLHAHPELGYEETRTSAFVAAKLREFGVDEVVTQIGKTGVVGLIKGKSTASGKVIGLRADMDALPMEEVGTAAYKSTVSGKMHACGHDGHTAMLLGAARYLAQTRQFDGTVALIFQPAEEGGAGAQAMIDDGLMSRFGIQLVFGLHNMPGYPVGHFMTRPGPFMAASDFITIRIEGKGAHAAKPHQGIDAVLVGSHIITALQSIVSRNVDPLESAVVSICVFQSGTASNVVPQTALLRGTARSFLPHVQDMLEAHVTRIATSVGAALGARVEVDYQRNYPVTVNDEAATAFIADVAREVSGFIDTQHPPSMGAEDFSFMLRERPGAFIFLGNGASASLHHPAYDFNDETLPYGMQYWVHLTERALPLSG